MRNNPKALSHEGFSYSSFPFPTYPNGTLSATARASQSINHCHLVSTQLYTIISSIPREFSPTVTTVKCLNIRIGDFALFNYFNHIVPPP